MLSVASYHAACVTDDGVVWVWGTDMRGEMGLDDQSHTYFPQQWPATHCGGIPVQMVACGYGRTLALTRDGDVWACGSGEFCQNGSREHENLSLPARVPGLPRIATGAAGKEHAAVVDVAGEVWTWGKVSPSCGAEEPVCVAAAAGAGSVAAVGALWMWGSGSHGQLGAGHLDDLAAPSLVCPRRRRKCGARLRAAAAARAGLLHALPHAPRQRGSAAGARRGSKGTRDAVCRVDFKINPHAR